MAGWNAQVDAAALAWRARQPLAAWLLALGPATATASLAGWLLKHAIDRPRPDLWPGIVPMPVDSSFPSGHSVQAAAFAFAALLAARAAGRRAGAAAWAAAGGYVGAVGLARLYLQVHFPSDVLGGIALGLLWVAACHAALRRRIGAR